ncbi:hypothetical protein [Anaerosporobacter sp.]
MSNSGFEKYSFSYKIGLMPVSSSRVNFETDSLSEEAGSKDVKEFIKEKIEEFSEKSESSVYNAKVVDLSTVNISERTISFTLYSMEELPILGRSVRLLSQLVLEEQYFQNLLVKKKLFKTFIPIESKGNDSKKKIVDVSLVSDTDLVKGLVDILVLPEYAISSEIRGAVEQMKVLAAESGLIAISTKEE